MALDRFLHDRATARRTRTAPACSKRQVANHRCLGSVNFKGLSGSVCLVRSAEFCGGEHPLYDHRPLTRYYSSSGRCRDASSSSETSDAPTVTLGSRNYD